MKLPAALVGIGVALAAVFVAARAAAKPGQGTEGGPTPPAPPGPLPVGAGQGDGLDFLATLPKEPTAAREEAIFRAVQEGKARFSWSTLTTRAGAHSAEIPVMTDALMIGSSNPVRVNVNHRTAQRIADFLVGGTFEGLVLFEGVSSPR